MTGRQKLEYWIDKTESLASHYHRRVNWFMKFFYGIAEDMHDSEMVNWIRYCLHESRDSPKDLFYRWNWDDKDTRHPDMNEGPDMSSDIENEIEETIDLIQDYDSFYWNRKYSNLDEYGKDLVDKYNELSIPTP